MKSLAVVSALFLASCAPATAEIWRSSLTATDLNAKVSTLVNEYTQQNWDQMRGYEGSPDGAYDEFLRDTKQVLGKHLSTGINFDFLDKQGSYGNEAFMGTQIVAFKFLAIQPTIVYAPHDSSAKAEFEFRFPIRTWRLPIGGGRELGDLLPDWYNMKCCWWKRLVGGFYLGHNVSSGKFRFGFQTSWDK